MITATELRTLDVFPERPNTRPSYISAASGLVCVGSHIYVVADDELYLGVFSAGDNEPGRLIRLFAGDLPIVKADRKRQKPDLEAIVFIPAFEEFPCGALLSLGSASRPNRGRGVLLGLDPQGAVSGSPAQVDMAPLLGPLLQAFADLNIEGAAVVGGEFLLFQRGNKKHIENAIIHYPLLPVLEAVRGPGTAAIAPSAITRVNLGVIEGVPLCITDAAALPNGDVVFCAVAEDTDDAYLDGRCVGAAIGIVDTTGQLLSLHRLEQPEKVEGISAHMGNDRLDLLLVTDADDPAVPAKLLSASFPL
ncbi:hypothetical protein [Agrobacterium sp. ICMP 6402]|uniref:DUF6929 family protein n=1 Tax=Agrobacterium sp. ICMP 6402 TaxID=2292443 RepID=UPI001885D5EE|nr:hypothetical protein [Agrobacterium sp. ICMP 6402]